MAYKKDDFDNLFWNPLRNPKKVREQWSKFDLYKEFETKNFEMLEVDEDLLFNYILLTFHKECVIVKDYDNLLDRKHKVLDILGVKTNKDGLYPAGMELIIIGGSPTANKMIHRFCTLQNNQKYSTLCALGNNYDRILYRLVNEADEEDMAKAIELSAKSTKDLRALMDEIEKYKKEIFLGDKIVADNSDDDFLSYARVAGFPELIGAGKIKINRDTE